MPKKILIVTHAHKPLIGGSTVVYDALAKYCERIEIQVISARESADNGVVTPLIDEFDSQAPYLSHRVDAFRVPDTGHGLSRIQKRIRNVRLGFGAIKKIAELHREHKYSAICIGNLNSLTWLGNYFKIRYGLPFCHYVHGEELTLAMHNRWYSWKRVRNLKATGRIYAASQFAMDALAKFPIELNEKTFLVGNGVDFDSFAARPLGAEKQPNNAFKVVGVGRHVMRKGFDNAMRAFALFLKELPTARLILIGDGPEHQNLQALRKELGLNSSVELPGSLSDSQIKQHLHDSNVFLMPNRTLPDGDTEGFGLVFLEANAAGKPVIGGRAGGAVGAIDNEISGFLVDPLDLQEISNKLLLLAENKSLYEEMSIQAKIHAERFSWRELMAKFEDDVISWLNT